MHIESKKLVKRFTLVLKLDANLPSISEGGVVENFLLYKSWFKMFYCFLNCRSWGGSQKFKKGGRSMVQGQVFLHLEITLLFAKSCYAYED